MKFTKEEAFDELKRQLKSIVGDPAINDKAITETVATLLPLVANDDTELASFTTMILPVLKTGDGNARKYASNAVKKREKELEQAAQQQNAQQQDGADGAVEDKTMDELLKRLTALEDEKREADRRTAVAAKRKELAKAIEGKGVKDKAWIDSFLGEVSFDGDIDVEASADRYVKLYNRGHADTPPSVTPAGASGGSATGNPFTDVSNMMRQKAAAEKGKISN